MRSILRALRALTIAVVKDRGMLKVQYQRQPAWLSLRTLRVLPAIAGGEKTAEEIAAEQAAAEKAAADAAAAAKAAEEAAAEAERKALKDAHDPERAMATIKAQRAAEDAAKKAAADARKERDDALAKLKEHEDAKLSAEERLKKEAEEGKALATTATEKLRRANLLTALAGTEGIADAKAAAKLIEAVEFDGDDEPTNLTDRVEKLLAEYPLLKGEPAKPKPPATDAADKDDDKTPNLTAEELEAAKSSGMAAERYEQMKGVTNVNEFLALEEKRRAAEAAAAAK